MMYLCIYRYRCSTAIAMHYETMKNASSNHFRNTAYALFEDMVVYSSDDIQMRIKYGKQSLCYERGEYWMLTT